MVFCRSPLGSCRWCSSLDCDRLVVVFVAVGLSYVQEYLSQGPGLTLLLVIVWLARIKNTRMTAVIVLIAAQAAYVACVGGDVFGEYRFFVRMVPSLAALTASWAVLVSRSLTFVRLRP
jgi:hypothetical protein